MFFDVQTNEPSLWLFDADCKFSWLDFNHVVYYRSVRYMLKYDLLNNAKYARCTTMCSRCSK